MIPDGWKIELLGEFTIVKDGVHQTPTYTESGIPFLRVTDIQDESINLSKTKYISKEEHEKITARLKPTNGDILYSKNGTIGITRIVDWDWEFSFFVSLALLRFKKDSYSVQYLAQYLQSDLAKREIYQGSKQGSVINLHLEEIQKFRVPIPPLLEQCKIAEVLGVWDESIDLLEKLIGRVRSRKQGLMQQLLTGKKRFKEFEGSEWRRYHFKDIFTRITRKNTVNNSNILTISGTHGLINQRDFFNKRVAADNLDGYYLIEKGEFAYNKSYSNGYPLGAIKRLDRYDAGVLSTLYICFGLSNSLDSGDFMAHYFESEIFNKEIYGIAQEGARNHGLLNIGVNDFFELFLSIPSLPEQEKIAAVLSAADEEISTLEKQLAAYKQQKLGLMQQLLTGHIKI